MEIALYIHIPFCDSKCGYCAFNSKINKNHLKESYMRFLRDTLRSKLQQENYKITSVYIGGGTPSVVDYNLYNGIFETFNPYLIENSEINIEANPNSCTKEWIFHLKNLGVNRLSLGVQSFYKEKLEFLERDHSRDSIFHALDFATSAGLSNISIDLIYGTPLCVRETLEDEVKIASKLPINHISAYQLSIDSGSRFFTQNKKEFIGEFCGFDSMGHFVRSLLEKSGFKQYEVSNYGRVINDSYYKSQHNLAYWRGADYLGVGAGAVSCLKGTRYYEESKIESFIKGTPPRVENLSIEDIALERLFLGFRSLVGVDCKFLDSKKCELLLQDNKVYKNGNKIIASDYFLGDELALFFS